MWSGENTDSEHFSIFIPMWLRLRNATTTDGSQLLMKHQQTAEHYKIPQRGEPRGFSTPLGIWAFLQQNEAVKENLRARDAGGAACALPNIRGQKLRPDGSGRWTRPSAAPILKLKNNRVLWDGDEKGHEPGGSCCRFHSEDKESGRIWAADLHLSRDGQEINSNWSIEEDQEDLYRSAYWKCTAALLRVHNCNDNQGFTSISVQFKKF